MNMPTALENIDVFILCGGFGKRLRKVSPHTPKPIVKLGNRRFLDIIIKQMAKFGFRRFILGTGYKAELIKKYYGECRIQGTKILFSEEKTPLDTGGAVRNAKKLIHSNPFFVLNGDSFCRFNPHSLLDFHKKNKATLSILLKKAGDGKEYGSVRIDKKTSRILSFNEKDTRIKQCLINSGVYVFDKKIFSLMPARQKFSLEKDFFPALADNNKRCIGYLYSGFFIDIGTPERYDKAKRYFK